MHRGDLRLKERQGITRALVLDSLEQPIPSANRGLLFQTDCVALFRALKDKSIDCIFADSLFSLGKIYGNGRVNDSLDKRKYLNWSYDWIDQCHKKLRDGGALFICILPRWGYHFSVHLDQIGLTFRHWIAVSMKGTFPRGRKLYPAHYGLLYFNKGEPAVFNKIRVPIPICRHCHQEIPDYGGHRDKYWPEPGDSEAFSIPPGLNCHHTIRRVPKTNS